MQGKVVWWQIIVYTSIASSTTWVHILNSKNDEDSTIKHSEKHPVAVAQSGIPAKLFPSTQIQLHVFQESGDDIVPSTLPFDLP